MAWRRLRVQVPLGPNIREFESKQNKKKGEMRWLKYIFIFLLLGVAFAPKNIFAAGDVCLIEDSSCEDGILLQEEESKGDICLYFFFAPGCPECEKAAQKIDSLQQRYSIAKKQINAKNNPALLRGLLHHYKVPYRYWGKVPIVFVGDKFLVGKDIVSQLEPVIKSFSGRVKCPEPAKLLSHKFVSGLSITLLALTDSVNPCALSIFLLLLMVLAESKKFSGKKIFFNSLSFIGAVFAVYFVLGVLIVLGFRGIYAFDFSFSFWLYKTVAILAVLLGSYNLVEFLRSRAGTCKIKPLFGLKIKELLDKAFTLKGMFVAGVLVSLFLLPCSAGPYFVAGGFLSNIQLAPSLAWLFYYNLLFVLPMFLIAAIASSSLMALDRLTTLVTKSQRWLDLFAGLFLIALGIWTWFS